MNAIQKFRAWVNTHPFKACAASSLFTGLAVLLAIHAQPLPLVVIYLGAVTVFGVILWLDIRKLVVLLLSAVLLAHQSSAQVGLDAPREPSHVDAGGVAIGITVVVIGGVAWYVLTKTCQKLFPKPPEKTNDQFQARSSTDNDHAASLSYHSPHSCAMPDDLSLSGDGTPIGPIGPITAIDLTGEMGAAGSFRLAPISTLPIDTSALLDVPAFRAALGHHGTDWSSHPSQEFYGLHGRPATAEQVPIRLDPVDNALVLGRNETFPVLIERSVDLVTWEPLLLTRIPAGQRLRVSDLSVTTAAFYRIR